MDLYWLACGDWPLLSLTLVESRGLEVVSDPSLQCCDVALCSWQGKLVSALDMSMGGQIIGHIHLGVA